MKHQTFTDWVPAPNIGQNPDLYELENDAIARDGRLDAALLEIADWTSKVILDVGTGTGYWLPRYAEKASEVIGIEPDPGLLSRAQERVQGLPNTRVLAGSAEQIPMPDDSVDIAHARFAYFFGLGAEKGLAEVFRVLKPGGSLVVIDNSWELGDFAKLLRIATEGNAAMDPDAARAWWKERGASRIDVEGGWACKTSDELQEILRMEFAAGVVDQFWNQEHDSSASISYGFAIYKLLNARRA